MKWGTGVREWERQLDSEGTVSGDCGLDSGWIGQWGPVLIRAPWRGSCRLCWNFLPPGWATLLWLGQMSRRQLLQYPLPLHQL